MILKKISHKVEVELKQLKIWEKNKKISLEYLVWPNRSFIREKREIGQEIIKAIKWGNF